MSTCTKRAEGRAPSPPSARARRGWRLAHLVEVGTVALGTRGQGVVRIIQRHRCTAPAASVRPLARFFTSPRHAETPSSACSEGMRPGSRMNAGRTGRGATRRQSCYHVSLARQPTGRANARSAETVGSRRRVNWCLRKSCANRRVNGATSVVARCYENACKPESAARRPNVTPAVGELRVSPVKVAGDSPATRLWCRRLACVLGDGNTLLCSEQARCLPY